MELSIAKVATSFVLSVVDSWHLAHVAAFASAASTVAPEQKVQDAS